VSFAKQIYWETFLPLNEWPEPIPGQCSGRSYEFTARQVAGEYALLIWEARSAGSQVDCGADSFVIRGGKSGCRRCTIAWFPSG